MPCCGRTAAVQHHACLSGLNATYMKPNRQRQMSMSVLGSHLLTFSSHCLYACRQAEPGTPAATVTYVHANAETIPMQRGSQDMITASYMVHEMPATATKGFLTDAHRALRPGGVIAIVDGDPW